MVNNITLPFLACVMLGGNFFAADTADFSMGSFVDVSEVTVFVLAGCFDFLCGFCAAVCTNHLEFTGIDTSCCSEDFAFFPFVGCGFL